MTIRQILLVSSLAPLMSTATAQTAQQAVDTLAFRQYLSQGTMGDYMPIATIASLYKGIKAGEITPQRSENTGTLYSDSYYVGYTYIESPYRPSLFVANDDWEFVLARCANDEKYTYGLANDLLFSQLNGRVYAYRESYKDRKAEERKLVHALQAFDSLSVNKPIFFADIQRDYKGNIAKYVKNLYRKSVLTNLNRLSKFTRYPKAVTLQRDHGVQFVIGLALYESWIRDVRERRVAENKAVQR